MAKKAAKQETTQEQPSAQAKLSRLKYDRNCMEAKGKLDDKYEAKIEAALPDEPEIIVCNFSRTDTTVTVVYHIGARGMSKLTIAR
jgi:hypothetical protein